MTRSVPQAKGVQVRRDACLNEGCLLQVVEDGADNYWELSDTWRLLFPGIRIHQTQQRK